MKIKLLAAVLIWFFVFGNADFAQNYFVKRYVGCDYSYHIRETINNEFALAGVSVFSNSEAIFFKVNSMGNILLSKKYYDVSSSHFLMHGMETTSDSCFLVIGAYGSGVYHGFILKLDQSGTVLWSKGYFATAGDQHEIVRTKDDNFIYANWMGNDLQLIKMDQNGNIIYGKSIQDSLNFSLELFSKVRGTNDNGIILFGVKSNAGPIILRFDSLTNPVFSKAYPGNFRITDIRQTQDGGFICSMDSIGPTYSMKIMKIDSLGNPLWIRSISDTIRHFYSTTIYENWDQTIYLFARFGFPQYTINLKLNSNGSLIEVKDSLPIFEFTDVFRTSDQHYCSLVSLGPSNSNQSPSIIMHDSLFSPYCLNFKTSSINCDTAYFTPVNSPLTILNFNPTFQNLNFYSDTAYFLTTTYCSNVGLNEFSESIFKLEISPNPATDKITISFAATASGNITVKIFSITGEIVFEEKNKSTSPITNYQIPTLNLSNGIYFLSVQTGTELFTGKIAVQH